VHDNGVTNFLSLKIDKEQIWVAVGYLLKLTERRIVKVFERKLLKASIQQEFGCGFHFLQSCLKQ
jgi:hypothetical protein